MPSAHEPLPPGGVLPPIKAAAAGRIPKDQANLFDQENCWAASRPPEQPRIPKRVLDALLQRFQAAGASSPKPAAPVRRDNNSTPAQSNVRTVDNADDSSDDDEAAPDSPMSWAPSPPGHLLAGGARNQAPRSSSSAPPSSPTRPQPRTHNAGRASSTGSSNGAPALAEIGASISKPMGGRVRSVLNNVGNVNTTPPSAQPQPVIPCSNPDALYLQENEPKRGPMMRPTSFGHLTRGRREHRLPGPDPRGLASVPAPLPEPKLLSSLSSPCNPQAFHDNEPPLRTSQSSPAKSKSGLLSQGSPTPQRAIPSQAHARAISGAISSDQHAPGAPTYSSRPPHTPEPSAFASKARHGPLTSNPRSQPFDAYCLAYPDYTGSLTSFVQACETATYYMAASQVPEFLVDDYVRVFHHEWLPYLEQQGERGEAASSLAHYYNDNVRSPAYTKRILTKEALAVVCPDRRTARLLVPVNVLESEPVQPPQNSYDLACSPVRPPVRPSAHDSESPMMTPHAASVHYSSPLSSALPNLTPPSMPPPPLPLNLMATTPHPKGLSAAIAPNPSFPKALYDPPSPTAATLAATPAATETTQPQPAPASTPTPSFVAGRKRPAPSSPPGTSVSRRNATAADSRVSRPPFRPLNAMGDPNRSTSGTANWGRPKKRKQSHPLTRDPIVTSQASRV